jgi:hypothetical protein
MGTLIISNTLKDQQAPTIENKQLFATPINDQTHQPSARSNKSYILQHTVHQQDNSSIPIHTYNMMLPSSLLASIFLLTTTAYAQDNGQWRPSQYGGAAASVPTVQTSPLDTTAATPALVQTTAKGSAGAAAIVATDVPTPATGGWESQVTWPAGCESWANPCPPGAKISGGGVAGYTNGFTSFLTETDSNGVITGMPTKATIAAGVSEAATTLSISTRSSNETFSSRTPSSTQAGFSIETDGPAQSNGAGATAVSGLVIVAAAFALLC